MNTFYKLVFLVNKIKPATVLGFDQNSGEITLKLDSDKSKSSLDVDRISEDGNLNELDSDQMVVFKS